MASFRRSHSRALPNERKVESNPLRRARMWFPSFHCRLLGWHNTFDQFKFAGAAMNSMNVIVSSANAAAATKLAASLAPHLSGISIGTSFEETRAAIARNRAGGAVVDLETCDLGQV